MEAKLSPNVKKALSNSRDEAIRLKNGSIGVEHLFLGILREKDCSAVSMDDMSFVSEYNRFYDQILK